MYSNIKLIEKRICKNTLYKGRVVGFSADKIKLPNGRTTLREYLNHPGAVAALPIINNSNIVMVRQYRYPISKVTLEIPAGKLHNKKDNPIKRIKAELKEETGYSVGKLTRIISFNPCNAFSTEKIDIYLARNLKKGKANPDKDEFLEVEIIPFKKALQMIKNGKIKDAKTIIALLWYSYYSVDHSSRK